MVDKNFATDIEDEDYGTEGSGISDTLADTHITMGSHDWDASPMQSRQNASENEFTGETGSASGSTDDNETAPTFATVETFTADKTGAFRLNTRVGNTDQRTESILLKDEDKRPCEGLQIFMGNGISIDEDRGFFKKSKIYLESAEQNSINETLQQMGCPITIPRYLQAYGNCTGAIEGCGLQVSLYDTIAAAFLQEQNSVSWLSPTGKRYTADIRRIRENNIINWHMESDGRRQKKRLFRHDVIKPGSRWLPSSSYYIHVDAVRPVPSTVVIPDMQDTVDGRALKFTDFAGSSFVIFEKAMGLAYAMKEQINWQDVFGGKRRTDFDKWFQSVVIDVTLYCFKYKGNDQAHPRFYSKIKNDYAPQGQLQVSGTGYSLWEIMNMPEFNQVLQNNPRAKKMSQDEILKAWDSCCGSTMIATVKNQQGQPELKVQQDVNDVRKTR